MGCRYDKAKHWAARIQHEAQQWPSNLFLTLTYRDPSECTIEQLEKKLHIPEFPSLDKKHLQDFIKRMREHFRDTTIRYYACGEYGDQNGRPHYHLCAFNLAFSDEQLYSQNQGYPLFISKTLDDLWGYGFATIGELTYESAAYTARYILKKMTGARADDHYLRFNEYGVCRWLEPEFTTMSRGHRCPGCKQLGHTKPGCTDCTRGIGRNWIDNYKEDVYPSDDLPIPGVGIVKGVPRFYDEVLKDTQPDLYDSVKTKRARYARDNPLEFSPQRLEAKFKCAAALKKHLRRDL